MTIQRVRHSQRSSHLCARGQDAKAYDGPRPMGAMLIREAGHQRAGKGEDGGEDACGETHLGFADAVVCAGVEVGDLVGERTAEVGAQQGSD